MLWQRVITALVLLPIVIWTIFLAPAGSDAFAWFATAIVLVGAWEWTQLMRIERLSLRLAYVLLVALGLMAFQAQFAIPGFRLSLYLLTVSFWSLAVLLVRDYPQGAARWGRSRLMFVMGLLLLLPTWLGLVDLHKQSAWWLLYVLVLVWGADTGAYFAGRALGKHKLAPMVSPGKTIEGFVGGLLLTMLIAVAVAWYRHMPAMSLVLFLFWSFLTVLASVLGDLFESMVKRHRGIKDSGRIFPGHGGALDRVDSLTAAAPVFMFGWTLTGGF